MRRGLWALLFVLLGLPIVFAVTGLAYVSSLLPAGQGPRVTGPDGIVGVDTGGSYAWVVPVGDDVVLIDAGLDGEASVLKREVAGRSVLAVLLTHAHADHTAGLAAFPTTPVWMSPLDADLLGNAHEEKAPLALAYRKVAGVLAAHGEVHDVADGQEIRFGGTVFRATATPGVTPGHLAWSWHGVLFTGDAVWGVAGALQLPPDALVEDPAAVRTAVRALLPLDFDTVADGQVGLTSTARPSLHRLAGVELAPPTVSVRHGGSAGEDLTGWFERAPAPDARGDQPEWLVVPGQPPRRLADRPDPGRDTWVGRWVKVHVAEGPEGRFVERVEAAADAPPAEPPRSPRALEGWVHRYTIVEGTVRSFAPLAPGAAWGRGVLALPDEGSVALYAPVALVPGPGAVSLLARVGRDAAGRAEIVAAPRRGP